MHKGVIHLWQQWFPPGIYFDTIKYILRLDHTSLRNDIEDLLKHYLQVKNIFLVPSGTTAIYLIIKSLLKNSGEEILIPEITCKDVASSVILANKKPMFLGVDRSTYNITSEIINNNITPKTAAVITVHQFGEPCDIEDIIKVARSNNILVIEDAAQSFGAEYKGKKAGTTGDVGIISFNNKVINAGGGGAIVTNDDEIANVLTENIENLSIEKKGIFLRLSKAFLTTYLPSLVYLLAHKMIKSDGVTSIKENIDLFSLCTLKRLLPLTNCIIKERRKRFALYNEFITNSSIQKPVLGDGATATFYTIRYLGKNKKWKHIVQDNLKGHSIYVDTLVNDLPLIFEGKENSSAGEIFVTTICLPTHFWLDRMDIIKIAKIINQVG